MTSEFKQGEFVYIPASTLLYQFPPSTTSWFVNCTQTETPSYLMFLRDTPNTERYCDIFYDGSVWSLQREHVYNYCHTENK